ncbi:hypothetical protein LEMLEM_LOCUS21120, partial [Lemmus lemmus]
ANSLPSGLEASGHYSQSLGSSDCGVPALGLLGPPGCGVPALGSLGPLAVVYQPWGCWVPLVVVYQPWGPWVPLVVVYHCRAHPLMAAAPAAAADTQASTFAT